MGNSERVISWWGGRTYITVRDLGSMIRVDVHPGYPTTKDCITHITHYSTRQGSIEFTDLYGFSSEGLKDQGYGTLAVNTTIQVLQEKFKHQPQALVTGEAHDSADYQYPDPAMHQRRRLAFWRRFGLQEARFSEPVGALKIVTGKKTAGGIPVDLSISSFAQGACLHPVILQDEADALAGLNIDGLKIETVHALRSRAKVARVLQECVVGGFAVTAGGCAMALAGWQLGLIVAPMAWVYAAVGRYPRSLVEAVVGLSKKEDDLHAEKRRIVREIGELERRFGGLIWRFLPPGSGAGHPFTSLAEKSRYGYGIMADDGYADAVAYIREKEFAQDRAASVRS